MSVTLMLRPSEIIASMAGTPAAVAGILTNRFGRWMRSCRFRAESMVAAVSAANAGDTSRDTNPSVPPLESYTGRRMPHASVTSSMAISQNACSTDMRGQQAPELFVVGVRAGHGLLEDGGIRGHPADPIVDQLLQSALQDGWTAHVVDPGALALGVIKLVQSRH